MKRLKRIKRKNYDFRSKIVNKTTKFCKECYKYNCNEDECIIYQIERICLNGGKYE